MTAPSFSPAALLQALKARPRLELPEGLEDQGSLPAKVWEAIQARWGAAPEPAAVMDLLWRVAEFERGFAGLASHEWGAATALAWWQLLDLAERPAREDRTIAGPLRLRERLIVTGDLIIDGDLHIDSFDFYTDPPTPEAGTPELIVFGELIVRGSWRYEGSSVLVGGSVRVDGAIMETSDWSLLAVGGDVRAGSWVDSSGELFVRGRLEAPLLHLTYNHGAATLLQPPRAVIFYEHDHGQSWASALPEARVISTHDMSFGAGTYGPPTDLAETRAVLVPKLREALEGITVDDGVWTDEDDNEVFISDTLGSMLYEAMGQRREPRPVEDILTAEALERFRAE